MNETKFLPDGEKVVVKGKINSTEYIVQKIFITEDGDEILSGEKFTTKNILDKPAKSYKDKRIEELEKTINRMVSSKEQIYKEVAELKEKRKAVTEHLKQSNYLADKLPDFDWDLFCDFFTGNIKYFVESQHRIIVHKFEDKIYNYERYYDNKRFEGVKSLSLYCTGLNKVEYHVGGYKDLSGSGSKLIPIRNDNELTQVLNEKVNFYLEEDKLTYSNYLELGQWIDLDEVTIRNLRQKEVEAIEKYYQDNLQRNEDIKKKQLSEISLYSSLSYIYSDSTIPLLTFRVTTL